MEFFGDYFDVEYTTTVAIGKVIEPESCNLMRNDITAGPNEKLIKEICTNYIGGKKPILDGFDHRFYIQFDFEYDEGSPLDTCDILLVPTGESRGNGFCIMKNCVPKQVMRFLACLGLDRMPEKVKQWYYANNQVIRMW